MEKVLKYRKIKRGSTAGITLIALVITIIILLILAGISIVTLTGENGLLTKSRQAKDETIVEQEKEQVELAYVSVAVKNLGGNVERKDLQDELDDSVGNNKTTVSGNSILKVEFKDTKNVYKVTKKGKVTKDESGIIPDDIFVALYNDGTLVFSNNEGDIDTTKVSENYGNIKNTNYYDNIEWSYNYDIIKVDILNEIIPTDTSSWFCGLCNITSIENIENINTTNVTDMSRMFSDCASLTSIDVSNFDTSNVISMECMFYMDDDFFEYPRLNEITGLNSFDTSNVTCMSEMFRYCEITELDLSSFSTNNVISMSGMFNKCRKLKTIYGNNWNTSKLHYEYDWAKTMFSQCNLLIGGNGTAYDSNHRDYTYAHIDGGTSNPGYFTAK